MAVSEPAPPRRRGLGRGLESLLGRSSDAGGELITEIDPEHIVPNPEQPRRHFDEADLVALGKSIRLHGLLQPIVVEPHGEEHYQLVAGERRWRAARMVGLRRLPAIVRPPSESARHALELALTENLLREDLPALEEAAAFARLADVFGLSHEAIAVRFARSRPAVSNTMRLLSLEARVQELLSDNAITAGHARALLGLTDPALQVQLAERVARDGLTVRATERLVAELAGRAPAKPEAPAAQSPEDRALERGLEAALGTPVQLQRRRDGGGRLVINFHDDEDLAALYDRLGGAPL